MLEIKVTIDATPELQSLLQTLAGSLEKAIKNPTASQAFPQGVTTPAIVHTAGDQNTTGSEYNSTKPLRPAAAQSLPNASAAVAVAQTPATHPVDTPPWQEAPSAPTNVAPAPAAQTAPTTQPVTPQYTLDMIANAGSSLIDAGKLRDLMNLLGKFGVDSLTNLKPEQYGAMAMELRALGARI